MMRYTEFLLLFLSTALVGSLLFFKVDFLYLQALSIVLLIILLLLFQLANKYVPISSQKLQFGFLFFGSLFIQTLVVATGGLASHFLLLAALFVLGLSFLRSILIASLFILQFCVLLAVQLLLDETLRQLLVEEPAIIVLFALTFIIVGSLALILNQYYHLKDVFLEVLQKKVVQKEFHEQSVLSNLIELIIITDKKLAIVSVNESVERSLQLSKSELLKKHVFQALFLKSKEGHFLTQELIPLQHIIDTKTSLTIEGLTLVTKKGASEQRYLLVIKPVLDLEGTVDQLIFIIRESGLPVHEVQEENSVLDQIITKQQAIIENVRIKLIERGIHDLVFKVALIGKMDRETRNLIELRTDSIEDSSDTVNIARVSKNACVVMLSFANVLRVTLSCSLLNIGNEDIKEIVLADSDLPADELTRTLYTVRVNLKWFDILLHKLIEVAVLLASTAESPRVAITLERSSGFVVIAIKSTCSNMPSNASDDLFVLNYGELSATTNLKLASGLEGYIAKRISEKLHLPIEVRISGVEVAFIIRIPAQQLAS